MTTTPTPSDVDLIRKAREAGMAYDEATYAIGRAPTWMEWDAAGRAIQPQHGAETMTTSRYLVTLPFGTLAIDADLAQASAPIRAACVDGLYAEDYDDAMQSTPYQTADARHDRDEALRLVVRYFGRDWYAAPNDERDDDVIIDELVGAAKWSA